MEHSPAAEQGKDKVITMIKKGLIIAVVLFLISSFFIESVYYGDCLVQEFKFTESMETLPVAEINTFNPNDSDGIYLRFLYHDPESGKEYSSFWIYSSDDSYQVGDMVDVVTRNGCPSSLLCSTKRKRPRTVIERAADAGYDCGMILHMIITAVLLLILWIPNRKMIPAECRKRKRFFVISTSVYAVISAAACVLWIMAVHDRTWDALAYGFFSLVLYAGGGLGLLISWLVNSVRLKKRAPHMI